MNLVSSSEKGRGLNKKLLVTEIMLTAAFLAGCRAQTEATPPATATASNPEIGQPSGEIFLTRFDINNPPDSQLRKEIDLTRNYAKQQGLVLPGTGMSFRGEDNNIQFLLIPATTEMDVPNLSLSLMTYRNTDGEMQVAPVFEGLVSVDSNGNQSMVARILKAEAIDRFFQTGELDLNNDLGQIIYALNFGTGVDRDAFFDELSRAQTVEERRALIEQKVHSFALVDPANPENMISMPFPLAVQEANQQLKEQRIDQLIGFLTGAIPAQAGEVPTAEPTEPVPPTETPMPTETPVPVPEALPGVPFPEQRALSGILQEYLSTMKLTEEQIDITYTSYSGTDGKPYALAVVQPKDGSGGPVPLMLASQNNNGAWRWNEATLGRLGETKGMEMGAFFGGNNTTNEDFSNILNLITKEFSLGGVFTGMTLIQPDEGNYNLETVKWLLNQANSQDMSVYVSPVIWFDDSPQWLKNKTGEDLVQAIRASVTTVARTAEQTHTNDQPLLINVVNEANHDRDFMYERLGFRYVEEAFRAAREAAPSATLIYNDYANHTLDSQRYQNTRQMVDQLNAQGLIDGVGIQLILDGANPPSKDAVVEAMKSYGVDVYVTEFSVNMRNVQGTPEERERIQGEIYRMMQEAAIESGVCRAFIDFQLGDKFSVWENSPNLPGNSPNADPTPYHDDLTPKPALWDQRGAFASHR